MFVKKQIKSARRNLVNKAKRVATRLLKFESAEI
jgi:hypothetical protein